MIATQDKTVCLSSPTTLSQRRRNLGRAARSVARSTLESLESRTLMSASFSTVDSFRLAPAGVSVAAVMANDALGNVYTAGYAKDSAGTQHAVIRERLAGTTAWTVIFDTTAVGNFSGLTVTPSGDLFACGHNSTGTGLVFERAPNSSAFNTVDQRAGNDIGLTADAAGNVFVVGNASFTVKGKTTEHWIVRERTAGASAFATVDDFVENGGISWAMNATVIPSGSSAGIYVVGMSDNSFNSSLVDHWVVRKSTDSGHSWTTVDNFLYDTNGRVASEPFAVAGDAAGNVYVVGEGNTTYVSSHNKNGSPNYSIGPEHWIVRKSSNGGATWSIDDDFQLASAASSNARAIGVDGAGNVYVSGTASDGTGNHSIVRTNVGGVWATIDDFAAASTAASNALTIDSAGTLYTAGSAVLDAGTPVTWFVRSAPSTLPTGSTVTTSGVLTPITASARHR